MHGYIIEIKQGSFRAYKEINHQGSQTLFNSATDEQYKFLQSLDMSSDLQQAKRTARQLWQGAQVEITRNV